MVWKGLSLGTQDGPSTHLHVDEVISKQIGSLAKNMDSLSIPSAHQCPSLADVAIPMLKFFHANFDNPILHLKEIRCAEYNESSIVGPTFATQSPEFISSIMSLCSLDVCRILELPEMYTNHGDWVGSALSRTGSELRSLHLVWPDLQSNVLWSKFSDWTNLTSLRMMVDPPRRTTGMANGNSIAMGKFEEDVELGNLDFAMVAAMSDAEGLALRTKAEAGLSDAPMWEEANEKEMSALEAAKTWEVVERPAGKNIVE